MHSPGICGVILAAGSEAGSNADVVSGLIGTLADCDLVLVVLGSGSESVARAAWARAAYVVQLPPAATNAEALRAALREVLNRGRDAALVTSLGDQALTAGTVQWMTAAYCAAGDEVWAVILDAGMGQGHPVLMGRKMMELFLRGQLWSAADEILSANLEHVRSLRASDAGTATVVPGAGWRAPWD